MDHKCQHSNSFALQLKIRLHDFFYTIRKYLNQYTVSINHIFLGNPTPTLLMTYLMVTAYKKEEEVGRR